MKPEELARLKQGLETSRGHAELHPDFQGYTMLHRDTIDALVQAAEERNEFLELLRWYYNYQGDDGDSDFDAKVGPILERIDQQETPNAPP